MTSLWILLLFIIVISKLKNLEEANEKNAQPEPVKTEEPTATPPEQK